VEYAYVVRTCGFVRSAVFDGFDYVKSGDEVRFRLELFDGSICETICFVAFMFGDVGELRVEVFGDFLVVGYGFAVEGYCFVC